jgi:hypothetical protein
MYWSRQTKKIIASNLESCELQNPWADMYEDLSCQETWEASVYVYVCVFWQNWMEKIQLACLI